jgi:hypothetical protein
MSNGNIINMNLKVFNFKISSKENNRWSVRIFGISVGSGFGLTKTIDPNLKPIYK